MNLESCHSSLSSLQHLVAPYVSGLTNKFLLALRKPPAIQDETGRRLMWDHANTWHAVKILDIWLAKPQIASQFAGTSSGLFTTTYTSSYNLARKQTHEQDPVIFIFSTSHKAIAKLPDVPMEQCRAAPAYVRCMLDMQMDCLILVWKPTVLAMGHAILAVPVEDGLTCIIAVPFEPLHFSTPARGRGGGQL